MEAAVLDDHQFPLVFLGCPPELDDAFLADLERDLLSLFARDAKHVVVCDLRPIRRFPSASVRRHLAELMNRPDIREGQVRCQLGTANVVEHAAIRAALSALFWVWQPPVSMSVTSEVSEAVRWSEEKLRQAGVHVPASVVEAFSRIYVDRSA